MKRQYIATVACRGGCGRMLVTATRLGSAAARRKYAGYCENCMTPEMQKAMRIESREHMQRILGK